MNCQVLVQLNTKTLTAFQVAQLTQRLEKLKSNGGMELNVEWTQIESASMAKHPQTAQMANRTKCRYGDLICPDTTSYGSNTVGFLPERNLSP